MLSQWHRSPRAPRAGPKRGDAAPPPPRRPRAWFPRIPARLGALRADGTAGFGVRRRPRAGSCPAAEGRRAGRGGAARTPRDGRGGEVLPRPPAIKGCRRDARRGAAPAERGRRKEDGTSGRRRASGRAGALLPSIGSTDPPRRERRELPPGVGPRRSAVRGLLRGSCGTPSGSGTPR